MSLTASSKGSPAFGRGFKGVEHPLGRTTSGGESGVEGTDLESPCEVTLRSNV
jgi:hypothetical protein